MQDRKKMAYFCFYDFFNSANNFRIFRIPELYIELILYQLKKKCL